MDNLMLCESLFRAFTTADPDLARTLCQPDLRARQNGGPWMDLDALLTFSAAVSAAVTDFHYENPVRSATADGFVEEHDVCATLPDGSALRLPACVVARVRDGRIAELREYLDSRAATGLLKALA